MNSAVAPKRKRKQFSLQEKVSILRDIDAGKKQVDISKDLGVAPSTIATILKDRAKITELHRGSQLAPSRKRLRLGNFQVVDQAVLTWFKDARLQDVPVSGPLLQEKAREFAAVLEVTGFEASAGWLYRFRQRNGITWQTASGEGKAADAEGAAAWTNGHFQEIVESYSEEDIFNADETACFYQLLPEKTMHFKGNKCKGGKKSKVRISVLFACNATGTKKFKPLVIGKYLKPRCMKNVVSLPCDYRANSRAWMTRDLFSEWLLNVDSQMRKEDRKILMIVDNCSAHLVNVRLTNVRLEFLPPNCTSLLQPLDQGIIKSVKTEFRRRLVQRLLINLRMNQPTSINVKQAAEMLTGSWWNVKPTTIQNCWRKAGLLKTPADPQALECQEDDDDASELWEEAQGKLAVAPSVTFDDYVQCDAAAWTAAELTTEDIVGSVREPDDASDEDAEAEVADRPDDSVSNSDVLSAIGKLRAYLEASTSVPEALYKNVDDIESFVLRRLCSTQQKKITDFFK